MALDYKSKKTMPGNRPAIDQFCIDYDMPLSLAKNLIGADEDETAANIQEDDYYRENGWPMQGEWKPRRKERGAA